MWILCLLRSGPSRGKHCSRFVNPFTFGQNESKFIREGPISDSRRKSAFLIVKSVPLLNTSLILYQFFFRFQAWYRSRIANLYTISAQKSIWISQIRILIVIWKIDWLLYQQRIYKTSCRENFSISPKQKYFTLPIWNFYLLFKSTS